MNELTQDNLYDCGGVRRADLRLRMKYYGLKTKIYLIEQNHYAIQIMNYTERYEIIKKDFHSKIRAAGDWIDLVTEKPAQILAQVGPLTNVASNNEGIFLTNQMFESLLASRFPHVKILKTKVEHRQGVILTITADSAVTDEAIEGIRQFAADLRCGFTDVIVERDDSDAKRIYIGDVGLACTDSGCPYSVDDSEFWFDNVKGIYAGEVKRPDLKFFEPDTTKCYMDFGVWDNAKMNIRSAALLYDKIYLSFPLETHMNDFLDKQRLTMRDLEELAERDKLVVFLPNTESRYNQKLIRRLYEINRSCVVSKRGINALMAMAYCEWEARYLSYWQGAEDVLEAICMELVKSDDKRMQAMLQWLLWPIKAKTESFELLTNYSPMKLPTIGANVLLENFWGDDQRGKNIGFEMVVNSTAIHIASALQATYFPFYMEDKYSDHAVANLLGSVINSYQYPAQSQTKTIERYTELLEKERSALYLLHADQTVEMRHILDYSQRYDTSRTLKNILDRLADLNEEDRRNKIAEYNNLIAEIGKENIDPAKLGMSYLLTGAGFLPGVGTAFSVVSFLKQIIDDLGIQETLAEKRIEKNRSSVADEVYLLDRLSRVARIIP